MWMIFALAFGLHRGKSGYVTIDYLDEIGGVVVIIITVAKFQQSSVIG
jgi:hypothetical protein